MKVQPTGSMAISPWQSVLHPGSGLPFTSHGRVERNFAAGLLEAATIAATLLHDVPEDTARTAEDIRLEFGDEIGRLVDGVAGHDPVGRVLAAGHDDQAGVGADRRREATATEEAIDFWGEFLHVFVNTERVRSHVPVRVRQGATDVQASAMEYDNLGRVIELKGRMRGVFPPPARDGRPSSG